MSDHLSWTISGGLALFALLSLGAAGPHAAVAPATIPQSRTPLADPVALPSQALAEAYFDVAKTAPQAPGFDDWLLRHALTVKGVAAGRGEYPKPEILSGHVALGATETALELAEVAVDSWRRYLSKCSCDHVFLWTMAAEAQARYDWWLMLAEAGAPARSLAEARKMFEDASLTLNAQASHSRIALL